MNLCISIGKRQYANELHIGCRKSVKLDRFARITLEKSIETDKWFIGSKSTNHGVHLPINRWAFSYNQGQNCPSSATPSSCCLVSIPPFCFSNYAWVNSEYKCSINAKMSDEKVVASYGPSRSLFRSYLILHRICRSFKCPHENSSKCARRPLDSIILNKF